MDADRLRGLAVVALVLALFIPSPAPAQPALGTIGEVTETTARALTNPTPQDVELLDRRGDAGDGFYIVFNLDHSGSVHVLPEVQVDGTWYPTVETPTNLTEVPTAGSLPAQFGRGPANPDRLAVLVDKYFVEVPPSALTETGAEPTGTAELETTETLAVPDEEQATSTPLTPGTEYPVRMAVTGLSTVVHDLGTVQPRENLFKPGQTITLWIGILFAILVLGGIFLARQHPERLFIRRIAGLDAVDEAIGRATEMGKPVMQINGLDPLSTLSTIAAVNILGQIARKVAHFDSRLMVPSFDPVVMTVSQETVKQAYLETGRPDAYREDDIFFVTDQQFSYTAAVCGIMLRERPAANFFLGYFYAESLLLAETGQSTGAIQIAGTDSQSQLPFFITTCDYTLIGEELYAASAYLSRDPLLLGSLKSLDVAKVIVMALILIGALLATWNITWLAEFFTPVS